MPTRLTNEIITAAILGFEEQKRHIDTQIAELRASLSGSITAPAATPAVPKGKRRKFSAAARGRMKEAQQRRWKKIRGESEPPAPATLDSAKPKRKMSAAGRKAISDATKKRWAAFHAAADKPKAAKKAAEKKAAVKRAAGKKATKKTVVKRAAKKAQSATQT